MTSSDCYEVITPEDFGVSRKIQFAHRLTGWNALAARSKDLGLSISDEQVKVATSMIKNLADERKVTLEQLDSVLFKLARISAPVAPDFHVTLEAAEQSEELRAAHEATVKAIKAYQQAAASHAVNELAEDDIVDTRPTCVLCVTGHLFDKSLLNRMLDILVDEQLEFKVLKLDVAQQNHELSTCHLQLWNTTPEKLDEVKEKLIHNVAELSPSGKCTVMDVTDWKNRREELKAKTH